jgi:protein-L-isoaspartate(D-aspartate) O-methyltransferase
MDFEKIRTKMVDTQLIARGIDDPAVIEAMRRVPRHLFVPAEDQPLAYHDFPIAIGEGQTISQPYMVALMTQALKLDRDDTVLEIGTGSGYQTAVLAHICKEVYTIERLETLSQKAQQLLKELGYGNVRFFVGDGTQGLKEHEGKFDAIMITACTPSMMEHLAVYLKEGGRLLAPVGTKEGQTLTLLTKHNSAWETREICRCMFVPLIGKYGWHE